MVLRQSLAWGWGERWRAGAYFPSAFLRAGPVPRGRWLGLCGLADSSPLHLSPESCHLCHLGVIREQCWVPWPAQASQSGRTDYANGNGKAKRARTLAPIVLSISKPSPAAAALLPRTRRLLHECQHCKASWPQREAQTERRAPAECRTTRPWVSETIPPKIAVAVLWDISQPKVRVEISVKS